MLKSFASKNVDALKGDVVPSVDPIPIFNPDEEEVDVQESRDSGIAFLIDLHAHAAKRGAFLFGNRLKSSELQSELLLYARLSAANSLHMDFDGCCFSKVRVFSLYKV